MAVLNAGRELETDPTDAATWAIRGVCGGLTVLWGESGSYKTFIAISMAVAVATGRPWHGHDVRRRPVLYVVGEGGWSMFLNRLRMAVREGGARISDLENFYALAAPFDLANAAHAHALIAELDEVRPGLIVVDTVSRCLPGDENKQEVMQGFVAALDTLRDTLDTTVLAVHHANARGFMRGSTVLKGAADVVLSSRRGSDGHNRCIHLKADKLKELDTEAFAPTRLYPAVVDVLDRFDDFRLDDFGAKITTLVLREGIDPADKPREVAAFAVLEALAATRPETKAVAFKEWLEAGEQSEPTLRRAIGGLLAAGKVVMGERGHYYVGDHAPSEEEAERGEGYELLTRETRQRLEQMEQDPDVPEDEEE